MGVKGLYTYLKSYRRDISHDTITASTPLRIGVDALSLMYKYKADVKDALDLLLRVRAAGHTLILVFDGRAPEEKQEEVKQRRELRTSAAQQATDLKGFLHTVEAKALDKRALQMLEFSAARLEHQGWQLTREIRQTFQGKLWTADIPYVKAIGEADGLLMMLAKEKKIDCIMSTDMDYLLGSIPRLWIPVRRGMVEFEEVMMDEVLHGENLTAPAFRDACILCGVEQLKGVCFPPHKAFTWMRYYGSIEALLQGSADIGGLSQISLEKLSKARVAYEQPAESWPLLVKPEHLEKRKEFLEQL